MKAVKHNSKLAALDTLTYIIGPLIPLFTLPQAYAVLVEQQTTGVSLATWSFYLFSAILLAIYGIRHKEKLLIITYVPFAVVDVLIVVGIVLNK
jgi:uncharacterized protein with PQ loop repeat